jgi:hypothetical protein
VITEPARRIRVHKTTEGHAFELEILDAPAYCHSLDMAPSSREPMLSEGDWVVLLFAVWSGPDRDAIAAALDAATSFRVGVRLGVRPFDKHSETGHWCPEWQQTPGSPVWLFFHDGKLVHQEIGLLSTHELVSLAEKKLATP